MNKHAILTILIGVAAMLLITGCAKAPSASPGSADSTKASDMLPDKTTFMGPFINMDDATATVQGGTAKIAVTFNNGRPEPVTITGGSATGDCTGSQATATPTGPGADEEFAVEWTCTTTKTDGERIKADLSFTYVGSTGQERTHTGTVAVTAS